MRRINWKFAAGLFGVLILSAAAAWGLYAYQSERIAQSLLWQARKYREEGQPEQAIRMAGQYLELRPTDVDVTAELAEWVKDRAVGRKQLGGVAGLYEKILRLNADDDAVRRKAVETYLKLGRYGEALDHIERLLQKLPNDAELLTQAGWCQQAAGRHEAAASQFTRAIQSNPKHVPAYLAAAALQNNQYKNVEGAGELYARAVAADPDNPDARAALAAHYRRAKRYVDAAREIEEGLNRAPTNATLLFSASDIASAAGDTRRSREFLDRGATAHPTDTRFVCALAWQLLYDGRADLAVQKLRAGKAANPSDIDVLTLLGDILAQDGQIAPLEETLRDLQEINAPADKVQPRIKYIQARLLIRRGRYAEAVKTLDGLRAAALRMPSLHRQVNALLAQCADLLGDTTRELEAFQRLLDQDSNAGAMRLEYARALARAGRHADALREFTSVAGRAEVSSRFVAQAARTLIERARPDTVAWTELQKSFEALKLDDANPNPTIARAELERVRNRPDAILGQIVRNIGKQPQNASLHLLRAQLFELKFGADRATAALTDAEPYTGDQAEIRAFRARLIASRGDSTRAQLLAVLAQNVEPFLADDRLMVLREIVAAFRLFDDPVGVTRTLERLAIVRPDDFGCREALYSIALRGGDAERRTALLAEIESLEGKDGACRRRLDAQRILWEANPQQLDLADAHLAAAGELRPMDPAIPFLRGRLAEMSGQPDAARSAYRLALERGFLQQPLEELLLDAPGCRGDAPMTILREELLARLSLDTPPSMVVAALPALDAGTRTRLADRLTAECPADHTANQAWLGRLFARMGLSEKSDAVIRRAASANSMSQDGWSALLAERIAGRDPARLEAALADLRQALPPIEANLLIGRAMESARRFGDARQAYEAALALKPDDPRCLRALAALGLLSGRQNDARTALEALVKLPDDSSPNDIRWARRNLALQLAITPSLAQFRQALELIDRNQVADGWLADDVRSRALILATQKNRPLGEGPRTCRQEAIHLLETLQARNASRTADDLLVLCKLYRAENDETKTNQALERMRTEYAGHYGCVAFQAREAMRRLDLPAAEAHVAALQRLSPGLFETLAIESQLRSLAGQSERARQILVDFVAAGPPQERRSRGLLAAAYLTEILPSFPAATHGEAAKALRKLAIELLAEYRGDDAEALQRLVVLLAQDGRTPAAIDLLQRARTQFPADVIVAAQLQALRNGQPTQQQIQAAGAYLHDELTRQPGSTGLRISLADWQQYTGQIAPAVATYRDVLQREPNNVAALNNLAWTLAAQQDRSAEALTLIQRAIDLVGPMDELLDTRARIQFVAGNKDAGLRDLAEAILEAPTASRLLDLAAMHRKAGQAELAERAEQRARQYGGGAAVPR